MNNEAHHESYYDGIDLCSEILEMLGDLPERAQAFSTSVESNTLEIMQVIERTKKTTDPQLRALNNMAAGVQKWLK